MNTICIFHIHSFLGAVDTLSIHRSRNLGPRLHNRCVVGDKQFQLFEFELFESDIRYSSNNSSNSNASNYSIVLAAGTWTNHCTHLGICSRKKLIILFHSCILSG